MRGNRTPAHRREVLPAKSEVSGLPRIDRVHRLAMNMRDRPDDSIDVALGVAVAFAVIGIIGFLALLPS